MDYRRTSLGFVSLGAADDPAYASGAPYSMRRAFHALGCRVVDIFPLDQGRPQPLRFDAILHRLNGEYYADDRTPAALRRVANEVERTIDGQEIDFLFCCHSIPVAALDVDIPVILSHDQTFDEKLSSFAFQARPPSKEYVAQALAQEQAAFANASLCIYPSQASIDGIASRHGVPPARLAMIPWGANLPVEPQREDVLAAVASRCMAPLQIIFVGRDWARKGGAVVLEACRELHDRGVDIRLLLIGCQPPVDPPRWATVIPHLDRRSGPDMAEYAHHLAHSHLLFMPSRLEGYGHAVCEAAAFGVPSVTTDVGGLTTIVEQDVTGLTLPISASPSDFADAITRLASDPARHARMSLAARDRFESHLNWTAFCRSVIEAVQGLCRPAQQDVTLPAQVAIR